MLASADAELYQRQRRARRCCRAASMRPSLRRRRRSAARPVVVLKMVIWGHEDRVLVLGHRGCCHRLLVDYFEFPSAADDAQNADVGEAGCGGDLPQGGTATGR